MHPPKAHTDGPISHHWAVRLGERIRELRAIAPALTQLGLVEKIGLGSQDVITRLERAAASAVNLEILAGLCRLAVERGRTCDWLLMGRDPLASASREESARAVADQIFAQLMAGKESIPLVRLADAARPQPVSAPTPPAREARPPPVGQRPHLEVQEIGVEQIPEDWQGRYVPIVGRLSAGFGSDTAEAESRPPGWADSYITYEGAPPRAIALRVSGESMLPEFHHGDIVVVDPEQPVAAGQIGAVIYEDPRAGRLARLKRIRPSGKTVVLESLNPAYPPIRLPAKNVYRTCRIVHHHSRAT